MAIVTSAMAVSLKEIARRTGLSTAAVSQALRGVGRISKQTRKKVQAVADELGYKPDPALSRALSRMRQSHSVPYRETIAFLTEWTLADGHGHHREIFAAATHQAEAMGYKIEAFVVAGNPREQRRMSNILQARGIRGLIILPRLGPPHPRLHFEWQKFAAVEIGHTLWHPRTLPRVETSNYHKTIEAMHLLKRVGYRRIGMAIEPAQNSHQRGAYYAAFMMSQLRLPASRRIPALATTGIWSEKTFRAWMEKYQPDVLIVHAVVAPEIVNWLTRMKLRVPRDVSLFCVNIQDEESGSWSGLRRDLTTIGQSAVEMLSLLLLNGKLGGTANSRCLQIDELWVAGKTLSKPIGEYLTPEGFLRPALLRFKVES